MLTSSTNNVIASANEAEALINTYFSNVVEKLEVYARLENDPTVAELQTLKGMDVALDSLSIVNADGELIASTAQEQNKNIAQAPEFKVATFLDGRTYLGNTYVQQGRELITIAVPLKSNSGVLVATVTLVPLWAQLAEIKLGEQGTVYVIDKNGFILYHPNKKDFAFGKKVTSVGEVKRALTMKSIETTVIQSRNEAGNDAQTYHLSNKLMRWHIIAQMPLAETLQPLNNIYFYAALLFFSAIVFAILLSLTLTNSTIVAFKNLQAGFDNFTKGNLAFRVPVAGAGELEELAKSLNGMIGQIHDAYLKVDRERKEVATQKAFAEKAFATEKEHMQHVLSDDREKVNYGLFVEKEKVNAIMANITDAIILLTKKREIIFYNKAAEDLLGHTTQDMQHKLITAAMKVFEKDTEVSWDEYAPLQSSSSGIVCKKDKVRIENQGIEARYATLITIKTNFNEQDDLGYIIVLHNLNQEIELEKTEMKFVGRVVNELKSAVTLMQQCLPSLAQDEVNETKRIYVTGIQSGVDQIAFLMQNFQLAMQLEEGTLKPDMKKIDITESIRDVFDMLNPQIQMKFLTVNYHQPDDPVSAVSVDQGHVRDVLLNLLNNAIKFTPVHGIITVEVKQFGDEVLVQVQDSGFGIAKEHTPNVFNKFYTIPDVKVPELVGAGVGLYVAKSLVELNNGKIWADSIQDKGSTFGFSFPKIRG